MSPSFSPSSENQSPEWPSQTPSWPPHTSQQCPFDNSEPQNKTVCSLDEIMTAIISFIASPVSVIRSVWGNNLISCLLFSLSAEALMTNWFAVERFAVRETSSYRLCSASSVCTAEADQWTEGRGVNRGEEWCTDWLQVESMHHVAGLFQSCLCPLCFDFINLVLLTVLSCLCPPCFCLHLSLFLYIYPSPLPRAVLWRPSQSLQYHSRLLSQWFRGIHRWPRSAGWEMRWLAQTTSASWCREKKRNSVGGGVKEEIRVIVNVQTAEQIWSSS